MVEPKVMITISPKQFLAFGSTSIVFLLIGIALGYSWFHPDTFEERCKSYNGQIYTATVLDSHSKYGRGQRFCSIDENPPPRWKF